MAPKSKTNATSKGPSEKERKEESSKAAQAALSAQQEAKNLRQAAAGAGDPDERQKLLNEALEKEMASERFGKTAKYLQSGTFQGLAAGGGIGTGVGAGLGTLTGTLVGGTASLATGGLGAAAGAGVGAVHGPFIKMGDVAGNAVKKVSGTLPGWEATEEQKKTLEKMIGQVDKQEAPTAEDLQAMSGGAPAADDAAGAAAKAAGSGTGANTKRQPKKLKTAGNGQSSGSYGTSKVAPGPRSGGAGAKAGVPASDNMKSTAANRNSGASHARKSEQQKKPRKLEVRSKKNADA